MYVCVCHVVTDKEINAAIDRGAHTLEAVIDACCAGGDCGGCHGAIEDMIEARAEAAGPSRRHLPVSRPRPPLAEPDQPSPEP
jgi:bacterioferritin-associated ferredoxin